MYHLASVRLRDLCAKLDISSELRRKIWTCFEYSLVHCTELMKDRHLDQLLMCAVYVVAKVCLWSRQLCFFLPLPSKCVRGVFLFLSGDQRGQILPEHHEELPHSASGQQQRKNLWVRSAALHWYACRKLPNRTFLIFYIYSLLNLLIKDPSVSVAAISSHKFHQKCFRSFIYILAKHPLSSAGIFQPVPMFLCLCD